MHKLVDEEETGKEAIHIPLKDLDEDSKEVFNWGED